MKIRQLGVEFFHVGELMDGWTNGRTDMTQVIVYFRNFANAPKTANFLRHTDSKPDHKHGTLRHTLRKV